MVEQTAGSPSDKRSFSRFPIEFDIDVFGKDIEGKKFTEKTILRDVSGSGARFITQDVDPYFPGQQLELAIHLPGTTEVKAYMKTISTVVQIYPLSEAEQEGNMKKRNIGVTFNAPLHFG